MRLKFWLFFFVLFFVFALKSVEASENDDKYVKMLESKTTSETFLLSSEPHILPEGPAYMIICEYCKYGQDIFMQNKDGAIYKGIVLDDYSVHNDGFSTLFVKCPGFVFDSIFIDDLNVKF